MSAADQVHEEKARLRPALKELIQRQKGCFVGHPMWKHAAEQVMHSISHTEPDSISVVVGPPGVGKTTLLRELAKQLREDLPTESPCDVPVVRLALKANEEGVFSWKDFYCRVIELLNPPLAVELLNHESNLAVPGKRATVDVLRRSFELSIKTRNTKVLLLDEAQHVAMGRMAKTLIDQLDVLKSIADTVPLILCGPYALLNSIALSGQLARRLTPIHFPRYTVEELPEFRDALGKLAEDLKPWRFNFDWDDYAVAEYFFQRSIGCIGILRPWLVRAVVRSARTGSQEVTKLHLDLTAKGAKTLNIILDEVESGEDKLNDGAADWKRLKRRLSGDGDIPGKGGENGADDKTNEQPANVRHPGEAAPRRYATGERP